MKETLTNLSKRINELKEKTTTEESVKHAFILPFIQALGYDVFNPEEVDPEFTADVGIKKGEKVDYAIKKEGKPIILIECKGLNENLAKHSGQLNRYFHVTGARFGILTNGVHYRIYSDLIKANVMDAKPFMTYDITNLRDSDIRELEKFRKENFDEDSIINAASNLKYINEIIKLLADEFTEPSSELVRFLANQVYEGRLTSKVLESFSTIVKRSLQKFLNTQINDRIKTAISVENERQMEDEEDHQELDDGIITTDEEIEGYHIVKSIIRKEINPSRITHRDTKSYFGVLIDDNNRRKICRLWFNSSKKYIGVFDNDGKETKHRINSLNDIYTYKEELIRTAKSFKEV